MFAAITVVGLDVLLRRFRRGLTADVEPEVIRKLIIPSLLPYIVSRRSSLAASFGWATIPFQCDNS